MTDCYESICPSDDLWIKAIRRVFKGKASIWYRENKNEFKSWSKLKKLFKERFIGLLNEDDLYDELKMLSLIKSKNVPSTCNNDNNESLQFLPTAELHLYVEGLSSV